MNHPFYGFLAAGCAAVFFYAFRSWIKKEALWKQTIGIATLLMTIELVFLGMQP